MPANSSSTPSRIRDRMLRIGKLDLPTKSPPPPLRFDSLAASIPYPSRSAVSGSLPAWSFSAWRESIAKVLLAAQADPNARDHNFHAPPYQPVTKAVVTASLGAGSTPDTRDFLPGPAHDSDPFHQKPPFSVPTRHLQCNWGCVPMIHGVSGHSSTATSKVRIEGELMKLSLAPERKTLPTALTQENVLDLFETALDVAFHNVVREYDAHRSLANVYVDKRLFDRLTVYAGGGVGPSYDNLHADFAHLRTVIPELTQEDIDETRAC